MENNLILAIGDIHLDSKNLEEIYSINQEIVSICKEFNPSYIVQLGDFFDKSKPNPEEIYAATKIIRSWQKSVTPITIINGNHDLGSYNKSAIEYLNFLDINIKDTEVINNIFFGHFFVEESVNFDTYKEKLSNYDQYDMIVLGHYHDAKSLSPKAFHTGAIRYTSFGEINNKYVYLIDINTKHIFPIALNNTRQIVTIQDPKALLSYGKNIKIRLCINSFEDLTNYSSDIIKAKNYYNDFKLEVNIEQKKVEQVDTKIDSINSIVKNFIEKIEQKNIKDILIEEFKKENLYAN